MSPRDPFHDWISNEWAKRRAQNAKTKRYINVGALMERYMPDRIHDVNCEIIEPNQSNDDREERSGG